MQKFVEFIFEGKIDNEIIITALSSMPFNGFIDEKEIIRAYIQEDELSIKVREEIQNLVLYYGLSYSETILNPINWNEEWESNFQPISVDNFCFIRAKFHESKANFQHEIIITPKMAFGTGHHETTYMMIKKMSEIDFCNKTIFDYGTGTGILAILSSQLGAKNIIAIDNEEPAYINSLENLKINNIENTKLINGEIESVDRHLFDIILANINRHVILNSMTNMFNLLESGGILLLSGILDVDKKLVLEKAISCGFRNKSAIQKGDWICLELEKSS